MKIYSIPQSPIYSGKHGYNNLETHAGRGITFCARAEMPSNIYPIVNWNGVRKIGDNSFITVYMVPTLGSMRSLGQDDCVILKNHGIKKIVDLSMIDKTLKHKAENAGLEYVSLEMRKFDKYPDLTKHPIFSRGKKTPNDMQEIRNFTDNFVKLIKLVQEDNVVLCADLGSVIKPNGSTSTFYDFINAFKDKKAPEHCLLKMYVKDIYKNLSMEDKKAIGFTPETMKEFEQGLY